MQITHPLQYKEKQNESYKNCVCVFMYAGFSLATETRLYYMHTY